MNNLILTWHSWRNRALSISLSLAAIALGVSLFLGIEQVRQGMRQSFSGTISGTDLIVGARGGSTELLLYSVFHIGMPRNNISYKTFNKWQNNPMVRWAIPISLGDSHKGFRVVGTNDAFYSNYKFRKKQLLSLGEGKPPGRLFEVVIGSHVAQTLNYKIGSKLSLSHGLSEGGYDHRDMPFTVSAVIEKTHTPIDRALFVNLEAIEAIHEGWENGLPPEEELTSNDINTNKLKVESISAFYVGLKSRIAALQLMRNINDFEAEPLTAILPGLELQRLWATMRVAEDTLKVISALVILVSLISMLIAIFSSLQARRREMAILRSVGATPRQIFSMFLLESVMLVTIGGAIGLLLTYAGLVFFTPVVENYTGVALQLAAPGYFELGFFGVLLLLSVISGFLPAQRAYRRTLSDGLSVRL